MKFLLIVGLLWSNVVFASSQLDVFYLDQFASGESRHQLKVNKHSKIKRWIIRESKRNARVAGVRVLEPFFREKVINILYMSASMHPSSNTKIRFKVSSDDVGVGLYGRWHF